MPDGTYADYHANNLSENIMNSVDDNGHTTVILNEILDYRTSAQAVPKKHGWVRSTSGASKRAITTRGYDIKVQWTHLPSRTLISQVC